MSKLKLERAVLHISHSVNMSDFRATPLFAYSHVAFDISFTIKHSCKCYKTGLYVFLIAFKHILIFS